MHPAEMLADDGDMFADWSIDPLISATNQDDPLKPME
jgi:hypothetical protein